VRRRDAKAIEIVREKLASAVEFAASKTTASKAQVADVTAHLSRVLFVDEPERPAALRAYSARGALDAYLRVIARRELMRVVNLGRREVEIDVDLLDGIMPASDPEISILRARYRGDVDKAMRTAVSSLEERDRALLRYAFVDGLNVDEIGSLYDVHRATAARWVAAARERLGTRIRDELAAQLKIDVAEVDSIVRLVQSRIDVSLERVLRT
jgi:RNA polymerase sigma-70 factor, ECF subfamily